MRARELKYFEKKLLEKREELITIVQRTENYGRELNSEVEARDLADQASSSYTKEFMFSKSDSDRQLLQTVLKALDRIKEGTYGECDNCGEAVGYKRLKAVPWAAMCLECQEQAENGGRGI